MFKRPSPRSGRRRPGTPDRAPRGLGPLRTSGVRAATPHETPEEVPSESDTKGGRCSRNACLRDYASSSLGGNEKYVRYRLISSPTLATSRVAESAKPTGAPRIRAGSGTTKTSNRRQAVINRFLAASLRSENDLARRWNFSRW